MTKQRHLRASDRPYRTGAHGQPLCRWCQTPVSPPRESFCSDACVHEYKLRSSSSYLRSQVFLRDKGICRSCGSSAIELRRTLDAMTEAERSARCEELGIPANRREPGNSLWDADHVVPVAEGGGCCGLENIATLCVPCHYKKNRTKGEGSTDGRRTAA